MRTATSLFVSFLLCLSFPSIGFSGSSGNGWAQRQAGAVNNPNAPPAPGQNAPSAPPNTTAAPAPAGPAPIQNAPLGPGDIALNSIPLGAVTATGGGHYAPLPVITNGGDRTLIAVPNGSRVQAYVDGIPGPVVNAIPVTQTLPQAGGRTDGSPQFSADQKRVAYIVDLDNGKHAVVIDATMSPAYDQVSWLSFAPAGHHFAYAVGRTGGGSFIVDDGKAGRIYQGVSPPFFSPDGNHMAYIAWTASTGLTPLEVQAGKTQPQNMCVVLDGVEQKHFARIDQPLSFSQDGKHLAYLAGVDQLSTTRAVVDNQEGPAYLGVRGLVISDDGSRSAYVATKLFPKKVTQGTITSDQSYKYDVVVENGKEDPADDSGTTQIQHLCISHDGQRVAYVQASYPLNQSSHVVVIDSGKTSPQYRACDILQISPDGKTALYIATTAQGSFIVANGQEYGPFTGTFAPAFSADGGHWACCASTADQKFAVIADGKTIALTGIAPGTLSYQPGGQLMLRSTTSYNGAPVTFEVKGDALAAADVPSALAYSPNHQHIAKVFTSDYGTSAVKQKIAIDAQAPTAATYTGITHIALSDDGRHLAFIGSYIGDSSQSLVHAVYDGTEGPGYWGIKDLALSPDGQHVAYVAQKRGGAAYVVVDGLEGPAFQDVLIDGAYAGQGISANDQYHQVRFAPDSSLHFLAVINGRLYRCSYAPASLKGLPSMAAHEAEKPGPRDLHTFEGTGTAIHFIMAGETIYGVSDADGKFKHGTLFQLNTDGTGFIVLHDFYGGDDDGEKPLSILLAPDGSLFGTLDRKVFHYDPKSKQYALVDVKKDNNVGPNLLEGLAPDGSIVGFTGGSIIDTAGVFSMAQDGGNYLRLENGQFGKPLLMYQQIVPAKDGSFFAIGMAQNKASIVKFKTLKDTPALVHKFAALPTDGNRPDANLTMDSKGNLYGSTSAGGMSQQGVIYKVDADGSNYQVVYNPDQFAFTKIFVPGDDGMLYGIAKEGLLQLTPDGTNKAPATVVAFDGSPDTMYRGATPNIIFHNGAVYALQNKAIYKVTLPQGGGPAGAAAPTVVMVAIQPQPLAAEPITLTDPTGAAVAGAPVGTTPPTPSPPAPTPTVTPIAGNTPPDSPPATQPAPPATQPTPPDTITQKTNDAKNAVNNAANALKGLGGLFGHH